MKKNKGLPYGPLINHVIPPKYPQDIPSHKIVLLKKVGKLCDIKIGITVSRYHEDNIPYITLQLVGYSGNMKEFLGFFYEWVYGSKSYKKQISHENRLRRIRFKKKDDPRYKLIPHSSRVASSFYKIEVNYIKLLVKQLLENKYKLSYKRNFSNKLDDIKTFMFNERIKLIPFKLRNYESFKKYINQG